MPKSTPTIPTERIALEFHKLSPTILITAEQFGFIVSRTTGQLADDRSAGRPPPFVKIGGSIRYSIGVLREYIEANTHNRQDEPPRSLQFGSFGSFAADAKIEDQWPFAIIKGKPVDFFSSLAMQLDDDDRCEWLSLGDYLARRKQWAEAESSMQQLADLKADEAVANRLKEPSAKGKGPL